MGGVGCDADMSASGLAGERQVSGGLLHHSEWKGGKGELFIMGVKTDYM